MFEGLNKFQKILLSLIYSVAFVSVILSAYVIYMISTTKKPWTLTTAYFDSLTLTNADEKDSDEDDEGNSTEYPHICDVEIWANTNNNGQFLAEMQWNSYTDIEGQGIEGFGIQLVGANYEILNWDSSSEYYIESKFGYGLSINKEYINSLGTFTKAIAASEYSQSTVAYGDFYFYRSGDLGLSYYEISYNDIRNYVLVNINDEIYKLTLKTYDYVTHNYNIFGQVKSTNTTHYSYSWFEIFSDVLKASLSDSLRNDYSSFAINLFDLSKYLTIQKQNSLGQFYDLPDTSDNRIYMNIYVDYHLDGATVSTDSMFNEVATSVTYDYYEESNASEYWNSYSVINLTEYDFYYKKTNNLSTDESDSYLMCLDDNFVEYLCSLSNVEININCNLNNLEYNVVAIDMSNFDFKINEFNISKQDNEFAVLNNNSSYIPNIV